MVSPPKLPGNKGSGPLDKALADLIAGNHEMALREAIGASRANLALPGPLFAIARALEALGHRAQAIRAYEVVIESGSNAGNLPLALAATSDLAALGRDVSRHLDALSTRYAKGSGELLERGGAPPNLGRGGSPDPVDATISGPRLLAEAEQAIEYASAAVEATSPGPVPAQQLFSSLSRPALRAMIEIFETRLIAEDGVIIEEATTGEEAFIVARGELEVLRTQTSDGQPLRLARLGTGALIGEMALLARAPRAATVIARRPTLLLRACKNSLDRIAAKQPQVAREFATHCHRRMVGNLAQTSAMINAVKPADRAALMESFMTRSFEARQTIIAQGSAPDGIHLIASGQVKVVRNEADGRVAITQLGVGQSIGEVAVILRRPAIADVVAEHPTVTLFMTREKLLELVREHPGLLAQLYLLAVQRDEETTSIGAEEAASAEDFVLI